MDTLISVATLAAWLWSLYALFFGEAGMAGMKMEFDPIPEPGAGDDQIYLEVAAVVTTFVLAGRHFEARAKRRVGAALTALLKLGAREASRLDADGNEDRVGVEQLQVNPIVAAAAMALSSVSVVTNTLRLRRFAGSTHAAG